MIPSLLQNYIWEARECFHRGHPAAVSTAGGGNHPQHPVLCLQHRGPVRHRRTETAPEEGRGGPTHLSLRCNPLHLVLLSFDSVWFYSLGNSYIVQPYAKECKISRILKSNRAVITDIDIPLSHTEVWMNEWDCFFFQDLLSQTREKQTATLSEVKWQGRTVQVKNEPVRLFLLNLQDSTKEIESAESIDSKISIYESVLKQCIDAQQVLRDTLQDDQVRWTQVINDVKCMTNFLKRCNF